MTITIDPNEIKSDQLNESFGQFSSDGFSTATSPDTGCLEDLRRLNQSHVECKTLSFNFDMLSLSNGPKPPGATTLIALHAGHPDINYQQVFRVYDDVQVMGYVADLWGVNRAGNQGNFERVTLAGQQSAAVSFNVKLLGNYTALDDELGYPSVFKSTEFNLLDDIQISFEDRIGRMDTALAALSAKDLSQNIIDQGWYSDENRDIVQKEIRSVCYPVRQEENPVHLLGGAEYIIEVGPATSNGSVSVDLNNNPAYHMVTALQITMICRCTRRRWA